MEFLKGIRIYNYRSIDSDGIELGELGKVNVLIGKNNSGKSNILRFISYLSQLVDVDFGKKVSNHKDYKNNLPNYDTSKMYHFDILHNENFIDDYIKFKGKESFDRLNFLNKNQEIWIEYEYDDTNAFLPNEPDLSTIIDNPIEGDTLSSNQWIFFINNLTTFSSRYLIYRHITYLIENYRKVDNNKKDSFAEKSVESRSEIFNGKYFISELNILSPLGDRFDNIG